MAAIKSGFIYIPSSTPKRYWSYTTIAKVVDHNPFLNHTMESFGGDYMFTYRYWDRIQWDEVFRLLLNSADDQVIMEISSDDVGGFHSVLQLARRLLQRLLARAPPSLVDAAVQKLLLRLSA